MKKLLLTLFTAGTFGFMQAQPVIENHVPPFGATYGLSQITSKINRASIGADQVWDYSSATLNMITSYTIVDPATVPQQIKDSVPGATWGARMDLMGAPPDLAPYDFFKDNGTFYLKIGTKNSGSGAVQKKADTVIMFNQGYNTSQSYGSYHITYAGYGTLKIGGKTYNNVVLLRYLMPAMNSDTGYQIYQFTPYYQLLMSYMVHSDTLINTYLFPVISGPSGISETTTATTAYFYPNPVHDMLNIVVSDPSATIIELRDLQGRALEINPLLVSKKHYQVAVSHIPAGCYLLTIRNGTEIKNQKISIN